MKTEFLAETALLGQGLKSCDNQTVKRVWCEKLPESLKVLAWLWQGKIIIGDIDEFLKIRHVENMGRYNRNNFKKAAKNGKSGFLTASATMEIAVKLCGKYVVSCGIGGIINGVVSADLPALCSLPVVLLCTSPKDMTNSREILDYLHRKGLKVYGINTDIVNGYVFKGDVCKLDGSTDKLNLLPHDCPLVLNPIAEELRFKDKTVLENALAAGKTAADFGGLYHPAVNGALDSATKGKSSYLQLVSFIDNIKLVYDEINV